MQFVQYGMLGALAALAIPIVIHLMFRRQARTVELGTLQFLRVVLRDNARRRRLKRYLLLMLRLASVALLAFLFARPFLLAEEPARSDRTVVVLLDRSASMGLAGGKRPIDAASAEWRKILATAGPGTRIEAAAFDREVQPIAKPTDVEKALESLSAAGTDYDAAMAWARDVCVRSAGGPKEMFVLTDLQRSGLGRRDAARLPDDVQVHLVDVGRPFPKNLAVTAVSANPASPRPREAATITAVVRNASPLPVEKVPVRLHLESPASSPIDLDRTIDLDGDASATVDFPLPTTTEGVWRGFVEVKAGDDLSFDDRRFLAFPVATAARVLLVDGKPGRTEIEGSTYFLEAALRLAPKGETYAKTPFDPETIDGSLGSGLPDLSKTSAVVLSNVADLSAAEAKALADFVAKGGGLIVFTGDRVTAEGTATLIAAGLSVGRSEGPVSMSGLPWRLDRWEASHPMMTPLSDPEHGDLRRPSFTTITRIVPDADAPVLARFRGGEPALIERSVGRGKVVWFASGCDRAWGDWPRGRMFLPMVHQMVAYASGLAEGGPVRQELAGAGRPPGVSEADGMVRVVNADPYESEPARCTPKEFSDRYGFRLPEGEAVAKTGQDAGASADDRLRGDELWPWLALTLLGILMFEQFLANRTAA